MSLRDALTPYMDARVLAHVDLHVVETLSRIYGEPSPAAALAFALALRAPRAGHIAVDLGTMGPDHIASEAVDTEAVQALRWPSKAIWRRDIHASGWLGKCFELEGDLLYSHRALRDERDVAELLLDRAKAPLDPIREPAVFADAAHQLFRPPVQRDGTWPADPGGLNRQRLAGVIGSLARLAVITGGPGMGKTWTVRNLLALSWIQDPTTRVALAAPTGKAAARMQEAIGRDLAGFAHALGAAVPDPQGVLAQLQELPSFTLHRLIGLRPGLDPRPKHHPDQPLPFDLVIVDEASMVDLGMMRHLLRAMDPSARLVLLGDRHQLASVEAGSVLADLTASLPDPPEFRPETAQALAPVPTLDLSALGVPLLQGPALRDRVVAFNRTYRFADDSGIGQFAKACMSKPFLTRRALAALKRPDAQRMEPERAAVSETVRAGLQPYLRLLHADWRMEPETWPTQEDYHSDLLRAFDQFRVLCAHRRGPWGTQDLNQSIEDWLAGAGLLRPQGLHWLGRPVLIARNDPASGLFNGDIGLVVRRDERLMAVFPAEDGVKYISLGRLPEHGTVFAMTIHKSQGSEFEHAMVVLPLRESPILTRELVYTGITRGKKQVTVVGSEPVLRHALSRTVHRDSGLAERLWGSPNAPTPQIGLPFA